MNIVILGLSVTSSWGNGHATTYRSLIKGLSARGHSVLFLERDLPWYAGNRDEPQPPGARTLLYQSAAELMATFEKQVSGADLTIVGSFVPEGIAVGKWVTGVARGVTAFYDIDTPVTLEKLQGETGEGPDYITPELIPEYDIYLSFTGGPTLNHIARRFGSPMVRALYCSVDTRQYIPVLSAIKWDLGYLGTYSEDRQQGLRTLMLEPARRLPDARFAVAGPMYPETIAWPENVERTIHLSPHEHPAFYAAQRYTLNITRDAMKRAGHSPSVRLFEAGACGVPIVSDWWAGLDSIFSPGKEILLAESSEDVLRHLRDRPESDRLKMGALARQRVLAEHTPAKRALQLEEYVKEASEAGKPKAVHA